MESDPLTQKIIGCAIEVHRTLGPGLLESTYERCLSHELSLADVSHQTQVSMPVNYKGKQLNCGYRIDLLVSDSVIVELKSVDRLNSVHQAQLLTYLKLAKISTGLLINFNQTRLTDGIKRLKL